jgi:hypothetical protein
MQAFTNGLGVRLALIARRVEELLEGVVIITIKVIHKQLIGMVVDRDIHLPQHQH